MYRIASHAQRFKELVGADAEAETMEEKITLALGYVPFLLRIVLMNRRRERDTTEAETSSAAASRHHSQLQTSLNIAKQNLKSKKDELSRLLAALWCEDELMDQVWRN